LCSSGKTGGNIFPDRRPLFYYITDRKGLVRKNLLACIERVIDWGADFVQIREKDLPDQELFELTSKTLALARGSRCRILVNGRADIALASGAHGVHLPSTGLRLPDLASWLPKNFLVGMSAHSIQEVRRAAREGADYVLLGPVFATPSKLKYGAPLGLEVLRAACTRTSVPVFGLGGIGPGQIGPILAAGSVGVAGIGLFQKRLGAIGRQPVPNRHRGATVRGE